MARRRSRLMKIAEAIGRAVAKTEIAAKKGKKEAKRLGKAAAAARAEYMRARKARGKRGRGKKRGR